ncbi:prepilin-type cleavage/methylation protein [Clostridiales bacterium oral taxon 876 str. F0540]|nr:prepilin-type cleavage/methylation protein [Clostridiales bacterium oral taxon 876 str. F0540]
MNKNVKKKRKGFTLIELIIVLAIMAIIAAIAIPNFTAVRNNSRNKADVQSAETIKRTVMMLVADGSITPATAAATPKTFTVTFPSGAISVSGGGSGEADKVREALKDAKKPQGKKFIYSTSTGDATFDTTDADSYYIDIDSSGNVAVDTNN